MTTNKLQTLRAVMKTKRLNAVIVPTSDPHKSEYIADFYKSRAWLTGFTGSAGTAIVTEKHAGLWTDSRYFIQAEKQLENGFVLHKLKTRTPEYEDWLIDQLKIGDRIGIDPRLFSAAEITQFTQKLQTKQIQLIKTYDFFADVWPDRPTLPQSAAFLLDQKYTGTSRADKLNRVRNYLREKEQSQIIISALDDIAWLMNIRGNDIDFNPVVMAYAFVSLHKCILFIDEKKLNTQLKQNLAKDNIEILPYTRASEFLSKLNNGDAILADPFTLNFELASAIPKSCKMVSEPSIVNRFKAIKNPVEIENYKKAQIRDGLAVCNFLNWLETAVKNETITEYTAGQKIEKIRSVQENYIGQSFSTISAYQENAALPHYTCNAENAKILEPKGVYLIDSGAQYLDGTTDITRTVALGEVTQEQITDYTLVLKGHVRLAQSVFPKGTQGVHLDTLARLDLWQNSKDFGHGTGHGIGFFLNVHEGPQGFSKASYGPGNAQIEPGMLTTNEPGIYLEGKYGIRIENVLLCKKHESNKMGEFYAFETLTYCPYDKNLIDKKLLNANEISWINNYHQQVYNLLVPIACEEIRNWLKDKTSPL